MIDERELVHRAVQALVREEPSFEGLTERRDRKRRNQRIAAGIVGIAVFVAAVLIVTSGGVFDRTQSPAVPGGAESGPAVTGPTVTGPAETGATALEPTEAIGPVPETDYLLDLNTGQMTPLPESIVGTGSRRTPPIAERGYAASPDGSRLAYAAPGDSGKSQIFVANLDGTGIEQVSHDLDAASSPAWSPDGSKIAYAGHQGADPDNVFVLDLATGTSTQLTFSTSKSDPAAPDWGPWEASLSSFTPDGASIVYGASRCKANCNYGEFETRMVPVAGGESERLMGEKFTGGNAIGNARLSPDGSLLSYACEGWSALCVANADGTDERVLAQAQGGGAINGGSWSPDGTRIPHWTFYPQDVFIEDVGTGQATYVGEGANPTWLDDHTLIVEIPRCYNHASGMWGEEGCPG